MLVLVALTIWRFYFAPPPPRVVAITGETMGTTYTVKFVADTRDEQSDETRAELEATIDAQLEAVNSAMSTYKPDSELSRFNAGPGNVDVTLSAAMAEVVTVALEVGTLSNGALDVTVGPLVDRWGFGAKGELSAVPTQGELDALKSRLGHDHLSFDAGASTLRKDADGLAVDLSAVAKGYAVDQVSAALHEAGFSDHMVEVGGEVRVSGQTEAKRAWRLAIEKPTEEQRSIYEVVALGDQGMATSGDYRNFTVIDGRRYSHTIDPVTGAPITHDLASVTVVADTCARADALATALNVLGPQKGPALAEAQGIAALFLVKTQDGVEAIATEAFEPLRQKR